MKLSKLRAGQRVFVKELNQMGELEDVSIKNLNPYAYHKIERKLMLRIETPEGSKLIDWVEKNYTLITGITRVIMFVLQLITGRAPLKL